jgi:phosphate-selective porin OprO/OprP
MEMSFKKTLLPTLLIGSGIISNPGLSLANDSSELEQLRALVQELDQKVRVLDRKSEIAAEEAANAKKTTPVLVADEKGFGFKSADGNFEYKLRGLIQLDHRTFGDDEVNGVDQIDGFLARRIRPTFEGTVFGKYDFRFTPEFGEGVNRAQDSGNIARVVDAYIDARFQPWFKVRAGKFKPFVGLERLQSGSDIKFIERSYVSNNILPNRDVGVSVHGDVLNGKLNYAAGIFNGSVDGSENTTTQDNNIDKDYAVRVFAQPFKDSDSLLSGLGVGLAATYGDAEGTASVTNLPSYKTPGQANNFFSYASGVVSDGKRVRWSPQAYYYKGPLGLLAEYAEVSQDVRRTTGAARDDTLKNDAWHITASWLLTGEDASFKGVKPKTPFTTGGGWGAWELIARYQENNIDEDSFSTAAAGAGVRFADPRVNAESAKSWAVGVNWYLNQWVRLAVNYEETQFDGGGNVNDAGAATGSFTSVSDRDDERLLFSRLQISF